ncbi:hypothetical protein PPSIR1_15900 [Plesiocystis pacifica SIR-1]|uniref:Uncharacterized protein n=1 Tax=Plesiocystis pacifica SIR-1 TaxID=391625 RepID=A6GAQ8_9BACT|nr:sigma-70 family RNA polymerase sigma factor [Plesiocystis pacifica]EDM76999.1 hypothetical protein PPSIR1_15900 [Plesiocystis pacifica SIR-1]
MAESEDWQLLDRWRQGDQQAGAALLQRYFGILSRFFHNKVANPDDVADLVSETMLACTTGKERIRESSSFRSFLFAIAFNQLRRYYRKQRKRELERDDFLQCVAGEFDEASPATAVGNKRETSLLVQGLRSLPLEYQIILELTLFEELTGREIGELLDMPTPTVHTRLRRGKARLGAAIEALAANPEEYKSTVTDLEGWAAQLRKQIGTPVG